MKINQLKAGVVLSYLSMFLSMGISILYTPVMLRLLGQSEYGLYQLVASVVAYLSLLTLGFGRSYTRFYTRYKVSGDLEKVARLNGMFLILFSVIGIIALICGGILSTQVDIIFANSLTTDELVTAEILMKILVVNIALSFPFSVFNSYITANERYFFQKMLAIIKTVANPFVILPILLLGFQSVGLVVGTTVLNITIEVIYTVYAVKKLHMTFDVTGFDFSIFKEISAFSSFIVLNIVAEQINWNVDKFLLGMYQSTAAVAVYAIGAQLKTYYNSFSSSVSTVFVPRIHQMVARGASNRELTELFTKVGRIQLIILSLILTGLIIFGKPFITLWAGADYGDAYYIVLIMIIPATVPYIQALGDEIQKAKNMHKFRTVLYFGIAIINLIISIPLCRYYGGIGCAIGTALSYIVGHGILNNIYNHRKVGIDMGYFWKEIALLARGIIVPCVVGWIIFQTVNLYKISTFLCFGVLYVLVYAGCMWLFGLNKYEKSLFLKAVNGLKRKLKG